MIVILGIIVVGGALFLILSNIKLPSGRRLRGGGYGFGFGGFDGFGAFQEGNQIVPFGDDQQPPGEGGEGAQGEGGADGDDDGKVLFIFGSGEREERSLNEDDKQDE